jgi:hypothetical protein
MVWYFTSSLFNIYVHHLTLKNTHTPYLKDGMLYFLEDRDGLLISVAVMEGQQSHYLVY